MKRNYLPVWTRWYITETMAVCWWLFQYNKLIWIKTNWVWVYRSKLPLVNFHRIMDLLVHCWMTHANDVAHYLCNTFKSFKCTLSNHIVRNGLHNCFTFKVSVRVFIIVLWSTTWGFKLFLLAGGLTKRLHADVIIFSL